MDAISGLVAPRRNEDIALDLMRFIASTTGQGKSSSTPGFHAGASKGEDEAAQLLDLYSRCLATVNGKK